MTERAPDRLEVLARIDEYERKRWFDRDVENDPPTRHLTPGEVDYTGKKLSTRFNALVSTEAARIFYNGQIRRGEVVVKEPQGKENLEAIKNSGAIITCNHFNAFDNYAVFLAIKDILPAKRRLYRIIREGNYTSFPGFYGFLFRNCYTLPLSENVRVMAEMSRGVNELLKRGEKLLIYPEQGMWWNYRKPRPLQSGAFQFAVRADVPVLPVFITLADNEKIGSDGFPVQEYTVHIMPPIYPDESLDRRARVADMAAKNYAIMKEKYEQVYGIPLEYLPEES